MEESWKSHERVPGESHGMRPPRDFHETSIKVLFPWDSHETFFQLHTTSIGAHVIYDINDRHV